MKDRTKMKLNDAVKIIDNERVLRGIYFRNPDQRDAFFTILNHAKKITGRKDKIDNVLKFKGR